MNQQQLANLVQQSKRPVVIEYERAIKIFNTTLETMKETVMQWVKENNFIVHESSVYNYYVFLRNETAT